MPNDIVERASEALYGVTEGPWLNKLVTTNEDYIPGFNWYLYSPNFGAIGYWTGHKQNHKDERWFLTKDDANFMASARQLVPDMISEITHLRARLEDKSVATVPPLKFAPQRETANSIIANSCFGVYEVATTVWSNGKYPMLAPGEEASWHATKEESVSAAQENYTSRVYGTLATVPAKDVKEKAFKDGVEAVVKYLLDVRELDDEDNEVPVSADNMLTLISTAEQVVPKLWQGKY